MSATVGSTLPPHNITAEKSVLGAVLLDDRHMHALIELQLKPEHFYRPEHRAVYAAMLALYNRDGKIDHLTVAGSLEQNGQLAELGGAPMVEELAAWVPATGHATEYGRIVREQSQMRSLLDASHQSIAAVQNREASAAELIAQTERRILDIVGDERQKSIRRVETILDEETERLHYRSTQKSVLTGTPSGFRDLDEKTGGFQPGNLIILAARPSMGKSALVCNMAENASLSGFPVALFSLEMSESELAQRFVASQSGTKGDDLRRGKVPENRWPKILDACSRLGASDLYVDDSSDTGILEIRSKCRRLHQQLQDKGGLGMIIVDYLQLMRHEGRIESRVEQVGQISRGLKSLARELKVPVVALSQLSRGVEQRAGDKKPILSDLRECVTAETRVMLADGRRVPIAHLVGTEPEVLAVDADRSIVVARSDKVWCVGRREVFKVTLASGRELRATAKHRVLAGGGWTRISELSAGDRVALARKLPEPLEPEAWPDARVALLGQLIGDGSYLSGQPMRYSTQSEENSAAVANAARNEFGATVTRYASDRTWHQLLISGNGNRWKSAGVGEWLKELGIFGQRSHQKRIPDAAFALSDEQIALLLRHLWATDGSIYSKKKPDGCLATRVYYATSSRGLADDVAALLLRFGIVARIGSTITHDRQMWSIVVSGAEAQGVFLERVGAYGPRVPQAVKLGALLRRSATNVDTLPLQTWEVVTSAMAGAGVTTRGMAALRGTSYGGTAHFKFAPSRATIASYAQVLNSPEPSRQVENDLFWDRITSIEPDGEEEVYDLTVPGPASWLADGLVSHNSGAIEQDADLVMFIYRDEYYNHETTRKGEADVIIAKHRNGAVGEITLAFQSDYPRFINYAGARFD